MTLSTPSARTDDRSLRIGFLDSGLGLVGFADALLARAPATDLVLGMDPANSPYGALTAQRLTEVVLASAGSLAQWKPDAIVVACNTASVHTLGALRAEFEPRIPIIGTVPAIKSAAATNRPFAVWATDATTASDYQRRLIDAFAADLPVTRVAATGLADAIDAGSAERIDAAIAEAAARTPTDVASVVLGCTHYGLVADRILRELARRGITGLTLFDSPDAVAAQTLRRVRATHAAGVAAVPLGAATAPLPILAAGPSGADGGDPQSSATTTTDAPLPGTGDLTSETGGRVLATYLSGESGRLPAVLDTYTAGRRLLERETP
ncbi:glutamate racemase [Brevibacterium jeotgali]|uniref:Glutamate racemase n=1 Tax=Brevibacterium jeotgali TaxID=1262550 RepID=A0A2H1L458_9MICO|nr:aspartate/glutamate racemase family protein [Brevibacterium jeotgali]TWC01770.1 glutamate racemase [Brevibacterium jeotgali]SMY11515.1 glutamate racemase [Brevibacterium jeotgali]